ncbi:hypothetical protein [Sediminitomix flava]|uniref:Uncharacterized protein n=1 Tax=Sediminitomix flava TaxID=379075 RepID=A0A315ZAK8_SEDFL|nr:hypothetical protein [Sediminitomix flava]PWJ42093.1 hypothetical protein BC781_103343 [Sediminitomix flava]
MELDNLNALRYIIPETLFLLDKEKEEFQLTEEEISSLHKGSEQLEVISVEEESVEIETPQEEVKIAPQKTEKPTVETAQEQQEVPKTNEVSTEKKGGIHYLGENKRNILVIVDYKESDFYKSKEFQLLLKIMEAVNVTLHEFVLVNLNENKEISFKKLKEQFIPTKVFYYSDLDKNTYMGDLIKYDIVEKGEFQLISSDSLTQLQNDVEKKKQLWGVLRKTFSV